MNNVDEIALQAALHVEDLYCQAHQTRTQRTAKIQTVIISAIERAIMGARAHPSPVLPADPQPTP